MRALIYSLILLSWTDVCYSQRIGIYSDLEDQSTVLRGDEGSINKAVQDLLASVVAMGYVTAAVDTVVYNNDTIRYKIYYGDRYEGLDITLDSVGQVIANLAGYRMEAWSGIALTQKALRRSLTGINKYLADNGYPFHSAGLQHLSIHEKTATATLSIRKGPLILFDSIHIDGPSDIVKRSYLDRYLEIYRGEPYHHSRVTALRRKLRNLPFVTLVADPAVTFVNGEARVVLPLEKKRASRFDFIVGLVPADQQGGAVSSYTITGEFLAEMVNRFGRGESIYAQMRRLRPEVQEIDLRFDYPYLFGLPLGIDTDFKMLRNSDSFLEVDARAGLQFILSGSDRVGIQLSSKSNRLLTIDTTALLAAGVLPSQLDVSLTAGGVSIDLRHVDYRFNPTEGWRLMASIDAGARRIIRNSTISDLSSDTQDFDLAYDTLRASTLLTDIQLYADYYLPPTSWSTIKMAIDLGYKYTEQTLYANELYRIGGNKRLRGFEEQSILTDLYALGTVEYRLLLDRNSYLSLPIIDYAVFRDATLDDSWQTAVGIGMGLNFATEAGIFNVSFVAGGRRDIPLNIQTAKIHFGYVSLF